MAALELHPSEALPLETVSVKEVLNDLRIIVEPNWSEIGGTVRWEIPADQPRVLADRHGLLQVFLNLAQNSQRAVQNSPIQQLVVGVATTADRVFIRFQDSGVGVSCPEALFRPFQSGAASTGLGLYISRSLLRSYGGDLRFEPQEHGAAFISELVRVAPRTN
jgi:C4-dicarboxylate-specific signal transduction histidine kinase